MKLTRRDFLKTASAAVLMSTCLPQILGQENGSILGPTLQKIQQHTTIKTTLMPKIIEGKIKGVRGKAVTFIPAPGEWPLVRNDILFDNKKGISEDPKSLTFFGHITDVHVIDEESPARLVAAEPYLEWIGIRGGFRPQEDLLLWSMNAMVGTLNKIGGRSPFDFILNTGDCADNALEIELDMFLDALEGGMVNPDSGSDEDPLPGPGNDANDPFESAGLAPKAPVYCAVGNHDVLHQGNIPIALRKIYNSIVGEVVETMVMTDPLGGYSTAVVTPSTSPQDPTKLKPGRIMRDPRRMGMKGREYIRTYLKHKSQRPVSGFPIDLLGAELAHYVVKPKAELPLRIIVLDTTSRLGTALGVIDENQYEKFLIPELKKAQAAQELVIVVSHHPLSGVLTLAQIKQHLLQSYGKKDEKFNRIISELLVHMEDDRKYVEGNQLVETLKSYPNVFLQVAGHTHTNKIMPFGKGLHGYWEVRTCALLDFPQQSRVFEIVYEGNGIGAVHTSVVDHDAKKDSLAARCRELAYKDGGHDFAGERADRNGILRFEIPKEIAKKLERA